MIHEYRTSCLQIPLLSNARASRTACPDVRLCKGLPAVGFVCGLLFPSCPLAIARLVISVIVNSLQRQPFRALAHIFEKETERFKPSFTNFNPSPTVTVVRWVFGVLGSVFHVAPGLKSFSVCHAMNNPSGFCFFFGNTPATFGFISGKPELLSLSNHCIATITNAPPGVAASKPACVSLYRELIETHPFKVFKVFVCWLFHKNSPESGLKSWVNSNVNTQLYQAARARAENYRGARGRLSLWSLCQPLRAIPRSNGL